MPGFEPGDAGSIPAPAACVQPTDDCGVVERQDRTLGTSGSRFDSKLRNQAATEVVRRDKEPVSKPGGDRIAGGGESRGFRSHTTGSWSNRKTSAPHAENPGATPGESTQTVPWSNGDDAWPTPKRRRFDSVRDYWRRRPEPPTAKRLGVTPTAGRFDFLLGAGDLNFRPRGAVRSARLPVTQEIAGSNPVEGAGDGAQAGNAGKLEPTFP